MLKVLLADDERIIREGIATIVDWAALDLDFCGAAANGAEALEMVEQLHPDIIITDIKMPIMDGLTLISRVNEKYPLIQIIVLSGYGEFDFAHRAMAYGVHHYLLKPCNEKDIMATLQETRDQILQRQKKEETLRQTQINFQHVLPLVKEQFLIDLIMNKPYTSEEKAYYFQLLGLEQDEVRAILIRSEREIGIEHLMELTRQAEQCFDPGELYLTINIRGQILILCRPLVDERLLHRIEQIRALVREPDTPAISVAYTGTDAIQHLAHLYRQARETLNYSFYLGEGNVLATDDLKLQPQEQDLSSFSWYFEQISLAVRSGNLNLMQQLLDGFFKDDGLQKATPTRQRLYLVELLLSVVHQFDTDDLEPYMREVLRFQEIVSPVDARQQLLAILTAYSSSNYERIRQSNNRIVQSIIEYVDTHYQNPELSLKQISSGVLFMNTGYLSKLFKKETNERFSNYLTKVRMEKAKILIDQSASVRIYEITEQVGMGDNPQYFSQIFKKYTGYTPSEYKKR